MRKIKLFAAVAAVALSFGVFAEVVPPAEAPDVSSWHGANLVGMLSMTPKTPSPRLCGEFKECYFRWLRDWGFNFARLPMDYRYFLATNDWTVLKQDGFAKVDQAVAWGRQYGIHVQLCLHRAPGYTIMSWDKEAANLKNDAKSQAAFVRIWSEFARRYRGIPNAALSFNLVNEPMGFSDAQFIEVFGRTIDAIRKIDPGRFVMLDGNHCASTPVAHFYQVPLTGQAFRGYTPHAISHYQAWYIEPQPATEPTWPLTEEMAKQTEWIYESPERTLRKFAAPRAAGYPVMIGEFGCYNRLKHETCLAWMEDCLKLWQRENLGWAIWNVDGPFGFLDSERADVVYEDFEGHKLDRKMLDLLRRYGAVGESGRKPWGPAPAERPALPARADAPLDVAVKQTSGGPRLFVDGQMRFPHFYYGSAPCLMNLSSTEWRTLNVPLLPPEDTSTGRVFFKGYPEIDPISFADAKLIDLTAGTTNRLQDAGEVIRARDHAFGTLSLRKGHRYWFSVRHRATRFRTYFDVETTYTDAAGHVQPLPDYYGDTLGEATRLGAAAGVDFVTFSTYTSWGCNDWWTRPGETNGYAKIDATCRRLIALNPHVLLVPRVMTDAPYWMLAEDPSMRMAFDTGFKLAMSSVSSRPYRQAATAAIARLARHLRETFPRNFAGLQISGQNSAEWFYMLSQTEHLSGYDQPTREAFRLWLKEHGDPDWATAEVPTSAERHRREKDARLLAFAAFRQREVASFLLDLGRAAKQATDGQTLVLFFYGYSWELGGVTAGAAETGHYDFDWLMRNAHGIIDAFSSPVSYGYRNLTGATTMMSPAESVTRNGYLWFNEMDQRTYREEMWEHAGCFTPHTDPAITQAILFRDSATGIVRGYGDWWMDLFGRGWFRDESTWEVRRQLNRLETALAERKAPYQPQIAAVVHEPSFLQDGWGADRWRVLDRSGFARCGADYGQYLLADILENPPASVKLFYFIACDRLDAETQAKVEALKKARPDAVFVEHPVSADLTAAAIAARAKAAGVHLFVAPGQANVCSAEGFIAVQSLVKGPLQVDVGRAGTVTDFLTGERIGEGPRIEIPFEVGKNRILKLNFRAKTVDF